MNDSTGVPHIEPGRGQRRSYLLRLWCAEFSEEGSWRASLEDPRTGSCIGFGSLEELFEFLMQQTEPEPARLQIEPPASCEIE